MDAARREVARNRTVFEALGNGRRGQEMDQGVGNYYLTDEIENRNFERFLSLTQERGNSILDVACGDGVETEVLVDRGFEVTAFDFSANLVAQTAQRLKGIGRKATLYVDDVTDLRRDRYGSHFAGVMFAQAACFVPIVDKKDSLMRKVIDDLASTTSEGVFYYSTTWYDDPRYQRVWGVGDDRVGTTTLYARPADTVAEMLTDTGLEVVHSDHFDAGPGKYKNDYLIAVR